MLLLARSDPFEALYVCGAACKTIGCTIMSLLIDYGRGGSDLIRVDSQSWSCDFALQGADQMECLLSSKASPRGIRSGSCPFLRRIARSRHSDNAKEKNNAERPTPPMTLPMLAGIIFQPNAVPQPTPTSWP